MITRGFFLSVCCCCCCFEISLSSGYLSLFYSFCPLLSHQCCCVFNLTLFLSSTCTLDVSQNCKKVDSYFSKTRIFRAFCTKSNVLQFDTNESLRKECSKRLWRGREMKMVAEAIFSGHVFSLIPFLELDSY